MLALIEHCVSELHGAYAMEDTDSMAIISTQHRGKVPCYRGLHRPNDEHDAVQALMWKQVRKISKRLAAPNPYDRDAMPGSILKIEDDNFDPATHWQLQL